MSLSITTPIKKSLSTPIKKSLSTPIKISSNPNKISSFSVSDQISTPEKTVQTPLTRSRTRRVALSLKEVKKVAIGLQKNLEETAFVNRSEDEKVDDLGLVEISKKSRVKENAMMNKKYEELVNFFNSMECSIRLLKLKSQTPTFPNIVASIQNLTERRFTHKHLAQLKYILPEAIIIKKVMLHDPVTSGMYPDLHVSLHADAFDDYSNAKGDAGHSLLRRVLRDKLVDFSKKHPEGDEIPQEELPYPFSQTTVTPKILNTPSTAMPPIVSTSASISQPKISTSSHKPPRPCKSSFCRKVPLPEVEKTSLSCYNNNASIASKQICSAQSKSIPFISLIASSSPSSLSTKEKGNEATIIDNSDSKNDWNLVKGTPSKSLLTPSSLLSSTPEGRTPKRKHDSVDCDESPQRSAKRSTRTKLFMTPVKNNSNEDDDNPSRSLSVKRDILDILPKSLLQSIKEKESKAKMDKDTGVNEARRREKLIARLPITFDMVLFMFQMSNRSVLTKEELIHKIIVNNCKIVDRGEVEEQLKLLREIIPDWLMEKLSSAGDVLYSVDKLLSAEELRQRIESAK